MSVIDRALGRGEKTDGDRLELQLDDVFRLLANSRRRFVIDYVGSMNEEESVPINKLARGIAFVENDDCPDLQSVNAQQRKRVYISLIQGHLEQLADADLVEWDDRAKAVSPTSDTATAWEIVRQTNVMLSSEGSA